MRITKKNYPERLRKILNEPKPCIMCAASTQVGSIFRWQEYCETDHPVRDICHAICRDFVQLKKPRTTTPTPIPTPGCPCMAIGKKRAITRAKKYLTLWDQGKHHWQRECGRKLVPDKEG
jgi:hypothetical protein